MSIEIKNLTFGYSRDLPLINNLSIKVGQGESVAIMAPSGTGKSTLLGLIGGLLDPWQGEVLIDCANSTDYSRPEISWVFQSMHLLPGRTALENVAIAQLARGKSRREAELRAGIELDRFKVGELASRQQKSLSGGESQRVALARAAAADPFVVLADEPTANLDRANAELVTNVLLTGFPESALIVTTHDAEVAKRAHRILVLRSGVLELADLS